ncbi:MAG TPA: HlyD family efflux transporter periplasmic adaptor subunit [Planctomycetota bacterium]|nr:HlyD family efflux transporter periplasmic adaptor subunit [Planctomycetota bacterium]HRR82276.1 HlyD family efflux transporter periplasmic adaptor subunit [Planctomycetota bacterium]HRT94976.1 HlyD family efflux transporter periplasmic adaptor subunit [Planctomycetota bacterium]
MRKPRRIRTPIRRYLNLFRLRVIPLALWAGAVAGVAMLWSSRVTRMDAPAQIDALRQATLAPVQTGTLASVAVGLSEEVRAGQVLVRLDDAAVRAELEVAQAELKRLEAELPAAELRLRQEAEARKLDLLALDRTYSVRTEQMRLAKLNHLIEIENEQVNAERLAALLRRQEVMHQRGVIGDQILDDTRYQLEASRKKIKATREAIAVVDQQVQAAQARERVGEPVLGQESLEVALAPLRRAVDAQLERIREIQARRQALALASPIDGVVTAVYHWEGETVRAGDPVLMVADPRTLYVVSFIEPGAPIEPAAGMEVEVRRKTIPIQVATARVIEVGAQVERIPSRLSGPARAQRRWGRRVLIELPPSMQPQAGNLPWNEAGAPQLGETLFVRFSSPRRSTALLQAEPLDEPVPPL